MALPTTISGIGFHQPPYRSGKLVFISSTGNVYIIGLDSTNSYIVRAMKATDPTSSFSEVDSANRPVTTSPTVGVAAIDVYQVGDVLHIVTQGSSSPSLALFYHTFNMATDSWVITDETIKSSTTGSDGTCYISVRETDSKPIVFYVGDTVNNMGAKQRVRLARKDAGGWTVDIAVDTNTAVNFGVGLLVQGSSGRMHCLFSDFTNDDVYQRCYRSNDAFETFPSAFDTTAVATTTTNLKFGLQAVIYDSGGTTKVRVPYTDSGGTVSVAKFDSADTPSISVDTATADNSPYQSGDLHTPFIHLLVAKGTDLYLLYPRASDNDLYSDVNSNDGGWGTDTEIWDAVTIRRISANVYIRNGNYTLAYIVDNNATVQYNEYDLGSAVPPFQPELFRKSYNDVKIRM